MSIYLVTGACGGMGRALCKALLEDGHCVWGLDRPGPEPVSGDVNMLFADIRDYGALQAACETFRQEGKRLDGIIHLAGIYDMNSLVEMSEEDFTKIYDINLFGAFRVNRLFVPLLSDGGRVVIVSSELASLDPLPFTGIYGAAKTALDSYAKALRMELSLLGYPVIIIRPGAVRTALLATSMARLDRFCENTELYRTDADRFRRIVGKMEGRPISPERLASLVLKTLSVRRPRSIYNINHDLRLRLLSALPLCVQSAIIRKLLS